MMRVALSHGPEPLRQLGFLARCARLEGGALAARAWGFFQTWVPWPSSLRVAWLRVFGARVGRGVVVRANVNVSFPWRLTVGDYVWIGEDVDILSLSEVVIEGNVCISQRAYLCTGSHDYRRGISNWSPGQSLCARGVGLRPRRSSRRGWKSVLARS